MKNFWRTIISFRGSSSSPTIKYMYSVLLSIIILLGAAVISSTGASYVELIPSKTVVMNGERFYIDVEVTATVPVNAVDIEIEFLPGTVKIIGVDTGQSVLTIFTQEPKVTDNKIIISGGTFKRGFMGTHKIVTITAQAIASGQTQFVLKNAKLLAGDGKGTQVDVASDPSKTTTSFVFYDENEDPSKIGTSLSFSISADIDGDGVVSLKDISAFMGAWYAGSARYDFNNDNKMNFIDFSIILARSFFGETR